MDRDRPIRVMIADDQALVRGGFRSILDGQPDIDVVAEAEDGRQAVDLSERLRPDVVLMDIRMPHLDGIAATRRILGAAPPVPSPGEASAPPKVLILTTFDHDEYVYEALRPGASGFLLKSAPPRELAVAVRTVAAGETLLAPTVTARLIETYLQQPHPSPARAAGLRTLTAREAQVLGLVTRGPSNAEIAAQLYLSEPTVKTHLSRVFTKLGVRDRVQLVVLAYETGLIHPGTP